MKKFTLCLLVALIAAPVFSRELPEPDGTYLFASKGSNDLFLDVYNPAEGSETSIDGKQKPTVIYIFGGGFIKGSRGEKRDREWFGRMIDNGYRIISIDYRLGLKGANIKNRIAFAGELLKATRIAVDDLFSATAYIVENASQLGVDPSNIVVSGSSAGAITALHAEYEISNNNPSTEVLPEGFNYAGIMSFAGAIFTDEGKIEFSNRPCPIFMIHGTEDNLVKYTRIKAMKYCFGGSDEIAGVLSSSGYPYHFYRYKGHGHEMAAGKKIAFKEEMRFLEDNVMKGKTRSIDALVDDPDVPAAKWGKMSPDDLYK